jgi:hypothetical protein
MFYFWDVVEELAAVAYERKSNRISMSQIRKRLKATGQCAAQSVKEVRETLIQLGYHVRQQRASR